MSTTPYELTDLPISSAQLAEILYKNENSIKTYIDSLRWTSYERTLFASNWNESTQSITIEGITRDSIGNVGLTLNVTSEQRSAASKVHLTSQDTDTMTFTADVIPTIDIPLVINIQG